LTSRSENGCFLSSDYDGGFFMAKFFVAGEYQDSESKQATEVRNPATGEVVDTVPKGTVNDVRRAIDAAAGALKKWSEMAPAKRGAILLAACRLVLEQEKELATLLTREQGKPIRESIMEIRRFVHTLDHYGGMAKSLRTAAVVLDSGRHGLVLRKPLGVCGAIVPWNFPVSLMGNKLGPALLAGNTVVVKPAGTSPLTDLRCCELIDKAIVDGKSVKYGGYANKRCERIAEKLEESRMAFLSDPNLLSKFRAVITDPRNVCEIQIIQVDDPEFWVKESKRAKYQP